jgi:hypothetical protein
VVLGYWFQYPFGFPFYSLQISIVDYNWIWECQAMQNLPMIFVCAPPRRQFLHPHYSSRRRPAPAAYSGYYISSISAANWFVANWFGTSRFLFEMRWIDGVKEKVLGGHVNGLHVERKMTGNLFSWLLSKLIQLWYRRQILHTIQCSLIRLAILSNQTE